MKKTICILLIIAISLSLCGCIKYALDYFWTVPEYEQRRMLKHLEKKYGEEFIIKEIHIPQNVSSFDRGATVYPKGREDEEFYVD